jgi:hypothetical protein
MLGWTLTKHGKEHVNARWIAEARQVFIRLRIAGLAPGAKVS